MKSNLGNLEELILLLVAMLYDEAYSVSIVEAYQEQTGKSLNISAIHTVLYRLEKKGYLESKFGEASGSRGGKRKRLFYLTASGKESITKQQEVRNKIMAQIPEVRLKWN